MKISGLTNIYCRNWVRSYGRVAQQSVVEQIIIGTARMRGSQQIFRYFAWLDSAPHVAHTINNMPTTELAANGLTNPNPDCGRIQYQGTFQDWSCEHGHMAHSIWSLIQDLGPKCLTFDSGSNAYPLDLAQFWCLVARIVGDRKLQARLSILLYV